MVRNSGDIRRDGKEGQILMTAKTYTEFRFVLEKNAFIAHPPCLHRSGLHWSSPSVDTGRGLGPCEVVLE